MRANHRKIEHLEYWLGIRLIRTKKTSWSKWICLFSFRSYPEFITSVEDIFDSNGGTLSHPDSNVSINIDSGAIPDGVSQRICFQVVYDERLLLRDIPQTPGNTLICPVIQCGPGNISLLKPVEIVLPHCLYLDETKKESIIVYKCERFSDQGNLCY